MADMQSLMAMVQRLESQGVDVMGLLQGAAMGGAGGMAIQDRRLPPTKPFQGPGPGAVVTQEEMAARLAARDRGKMPSYMQSTLERLMRESGNVTGTRPAQPVAPGILRLLGGM